MRNILLVLTLTFSWEILCKASEVTPNASVTSPNSQFRYDVLKSKYLSAGPISKEDLEGAWLGRCYYKGSDDAEGMVNSTKKFVPQDGASPIWKNTYYQKLNVSSGAWAPANYNDRTTIDEDERFWSSADGNKGGGVLPLATSGGTVRGVLLQGTWYETRKGVDGFIYGRSGIADKTSMYCFFFERLF